MTPDPFPIKQGDLSPSYACVLTDADGFVDLTAAEKVRFKMRLESKADDELPDIDGEADFAKEKIPNPLKPSEEIEVWVVRYDWIAGDTDLPAEECNVEIEVTWNTGKPETFPADPDEPFLKVIVLEDLDAS
jgi:hypothetical protein